VTVAETLGNRSCASRALANTGAEIVASVAFGTIPFAPGAQLVLPLPNLLPPLELPGVPRPLVLRLGRSLLLPLPLNTRNRMPPLPNGSYVVPTRMLSSTFQIATSFSSRMPSRLTFANSSAINSLLPLIGFVTFSSSVVAWVPRLLLRLPPLHLHLRLPVLIPSPRRLVRRLAGRCSLTRTWVCLAFSRLRHANDFLRAFLYVRNAII
jgi:hypothetical protein